MPQKIVGTPAGPDDSESGVFISLLLAPDEGTFQIVINKANAVFGIQIPGIFTNPNLTVIRHRNP